VKSMILTKSFFAQAIFRSSIPLLVGSSCCMLNEVMSKMTSKHKSFDFFLRTSEMENVSENNGPDLDRMSGSFLAIMSEISFGIYSSYFAFLFLMLLIEIISRMIESALNSENVLTMRDLKSGKGRKLMKKVLFQMICFTLIFIALQTIGKCFSAAIDIASPTISLNLAEKSLLIHDNSLQMARVLQEEKEDDDHYKETIMETSTLISSPSAVGKSEKASLSMGVIKSSLNLDVMAMVLSKDRRFAFVTLELYGTLKIIDTSDLESPNVVGSLALKQSGVTYKIKSMILSKDEKTLYVSNSRDLEIVDVRDMKSPKLISFTESEIFDEESFGDVSKYFRTSLALDEKTKTLFIAGLGMQIFDISDAKEPVLLKAEKNDYFKLDKMGEESLQRNEICMSTDGKALLVANGKFDIYDISNPENIERISSLETKSSVRALYLSKDSRRIFLLGTSKNKEMILEEVEISNYEAPRIIQTFQLGEKSSFSPRILAVSPGETKFYIFIDDDNQGYDLAVFDIVKGRTIKNEKALIEDTHTMIFSEDGKTLITGSDNELMVIELFLDYPNSEIFGAWQNVISSFPLISIVEKMQLSRDGQFLFALSDDESDAYLDFSNFEIWDMHDNNGPRLLSKTHCQKYIQAMTFSNNDNTVILSGREKITVWDISNKSSPMIKQSHTLKQNFLVQFLLSSDEQTGFITRFYSGAVHLTSFSLSDLSKDKIEDLTIAEKTFTIETCQMILKDPHTLIVFDKEITIYDISDPKLFVELASVPLRINEPTPNINSMVLSADKNILFVETHDQIDFFKLSIYNISVKAQPRLISETPFSKFKAHSTDRPGFSLSSDSKSGFIFQNNSWVKIDLKNLLEPRISGIIPLGNGTKYSILSPDGTTVYVVYEDKQFRILSTNIQHTLYLKKEKFALGEKYSDNIAMLSLSDSANYDLMDTDSYKIIKLSLLDIKVVPYQSALEMKKSLLPSWITFDYEENVLTIEPKKQRDLGNYFFHTTFSKKIPRNVFDDLALKSEDLFAWLISLDYVSNKFFLTKNFGTFDAFLLPSKYEDYKLQIYELLKQFHMETCTGFEITSSLELLSKDDDKLEIVTPNPGSVKVDIKLHHDAHSEVLFLNKPYASLLPLIRDGKSKISLEGTLKEINAALESIVVDFSGSKENCNATMTMFDGLNPVLTKEINNMSKYVKENQPPKLNKPIQEQVDRARAETGQYFSIYLKDDTFIDDYSNDTLTYEIETVDKKNLPHWLSFHELTLRGTPPEDIFGREIDLVLVAKNEFKKHDVPFKLHVKLSSTFLLKLLLRYSPYILTFIGLYVSMNKILNILKKSKYKHPTEYKLVVGEDISPEVIQPVSFIRDQMKQSELILSEMKKNLKDFIDEGARAVDKEKIINAIQEALGRVPAKAREKISSQSISLIEQIIINKFVYIQLNSNREKETKLLFEGLKLKSLDCIEKDQHRSSGFMINQAKFDKLLQPSSSRNESLENPLISEGVNVGLLKDAIIAFAFESHTMNVSPVSVDIVVKQKVPISGFLFRFFKLDLRSVWFNHNNRVDYGINYKIIDDKLCFYGNLRETFKNKTLVVQILNHRHRILKEIWIKGVSQDNEVATLKNELEARGQGYEIF